MDAVNNNKIYFNPICFRGLDSKSQNVFDYIPYEIAAQTEYKHVCPNTLNNANCSLRQNRALYPADIKLVDALDKAFDKMPGLKESQTFYRALYGMHLDEEFLNAQKGDIVVPDKGYAQLGLNKTQAEYYLPSQSCKPVLLEMLCPKGSKASLTDRRDTGSGLPEGFMPRGAKFKVLNKEIVKYPPVSVYDDEKSVLKYTLEYIQ